MIWQQLHGGLSLWAPGSPPTDRDTKANLLENRFCGANDPADYLSFSLRADERSPLTSDTAGPVGEKKS